MSRDWIANKGAAINPKNEKDNNWFQWSTASGLNYNKIKKKYFQHLEKFKRFDVDFPSHQRDWEKFEQNNTLDAHTIVKKYSLHTNQNITASVEIK